MSTESIELVIAVDVDKPLFAKAGLHQLASELRLIGRFHRLDAILTDWLDKHGYSYAGDESSAGVISSKTGDVLGKFDSWDEALKFVLAQIDADIAALKAQGESED